MNTLDCSLLLAKMMKRFHRAVLLSILLMAGPTIAAVCNVKSPAHKLALIELYTSEGCSSCPPADRWLNALSENGNVAEQVVPIALHVDYWNYLGWKDPYSQAKFGERQRERARLSRQNIVYTPQVILQGSDYRTWGNNARFSEAIHKITMEPAQAELNLTLDVKNDAIIVKLNGAVPESGLRNSARIYLAVLESRLNNKIPTGENAGRTLSHSNVVRVMYGPFQVGADGLISLRRSVMPEAGWDHSQLGAAAFVQDEGAGKVLQAIMLKNCSSAP